MTSYSKYFADSISWILIANCKYIIYFDSLYCMTWHFLTNEPISCEFDRRFSSFTTEHCGLIKKTRLAMLRFKIFCNFLQTEIVMSSLFIFYNRKSFLRTKKELSNSRRKQIRNFSQIKVQKFLLESALSMLRVKSW